MINPDEEPARRFFVPARYLACLAGCFVLALALSTLGLRVLRDSSLTASVWWPLGGAALALLTRLPKRYWLAAVPGLGAGQFLAVFQFDPRPLLALGSILGSTTSLLVAALLLHRAFPAEVHLNSPRAAARFTAAVAVGVALGATVFAVTYTSWGNGSHPWAWSGYFRTHLLGMLLVSPLFLVSTRMLRDMRDNREWLAQLVLVAVTGVGVFGTDQDVVPSIVATLPLLWAGLRLGALRSMVSLQLMALIATIGTLNGLGPFGDQSGVSRTWSLQIVLVSLTLLLLFVVLSAQARSDLLRISEDRFAALSKAEELTGTGSATMDLVTGRTTWSPGLYRQLGLDPAQVRPSSERYFSVIHPADRDAVMTAIQETAASREAKPPAEFRVVHPDGSMRRILGSAEPELDSRGQVVRIHGTVHDVTAIRRAEMERRSVDAELAAVLGVLTETAIIGSAGDGTRLITRFNQGAENLLGWSADEVIGKVPPDVFHVAGPGDPAVTMPLLQAELAEFSRRVDEEGSHTRQWVCRRKDGTEFLAQISLTRYDAPDGTLEYIGVLTDLSEAIRARAELADSENRFRLAFDAAPLAMVITTLDEDDPGVVQRVNPAMQAFTGLSEAELLGLHMLDLIEDPYVDSARELLACLLSGEEDSVQGEHRFRSAGGKLWGRVSAAAVRPSDGRPPYQILMIEDITARRELTERLRHEAAHDALTGLPNRAQLRRHLDRALAEPGRLGQVAVLYIDLDGFKAVNDSQGHGAGDELLRQVADRIATCVRASDVVARLGGDEFAVLCPGVPDAEAAITIGSEIIATLAEQFELPHAYARIGASVGVALSHPDSESGPALLDAADEAMYQAKRDGKGRVRVSAR